MSEILPPRIGFGAPDHGAAQRARVRSDAARQTPEPKEGTGEGRHARAEPPPLSADDARLASSHAAAEKTLVVREADIRERLGALDRTLSDFSAQGADLSSRVASLLAPSSAL